MYYLLRFILRSIIISVQKISTMNIRQRKSFYTCLLLSFYLMADQYCLYLLWPTNDKIIKVIESSSHREQKWCSLATESNLIDCRISLTAERNFRFRFVKQNSSVRYLNNVYHGQIELRRWKTEMKSTSMHRNRRDNRFVVTWRNYFRNRRVFHRSSKISDILFNS